VVAMTPGGPAGSESLDRLGHGQSGGEQRQFGAADLARSRPEAHLVRRFKHSNDPQFAAKLKKIVGLYVNPPDRGRRHRQNSEFQRPARWRERTNHCPQFARQGLPITLCLHRCAWRYRSPSAARSSAGRSLYCCSLCSGAEADARLDSGEQIGQQEAGQLSRTCWRPLDPRNTYPPMPRGPCRKKLDRWSG
jgi:hypothetical protein